jgi:uncharacterized protein (DUF1330 family)
MTVYVIVQLKMTDRAAYDRYQARFFEVVRRFSGRLLSADEHPLVIEGKWDCDKLVLMSFPDETAFRAWSTRRTIRRYRGIAKRARKRSCRSPKASRREPKARHHHSQP